MPEKSQEFNPRSMEKMMRDLQKLLDQQEFDSAEEANAFMQQFVGQRVPEMPVDDDPLSQAQDLVYQAYDATSRKEAITLARQALELSPDCADAYVLRKKRMPKQLPAYVGFGDEDEAVSYAWDGLALWRNSYGALRWLSRQTRARR